MDDLVDDQEVAVFSVNTANEMYSLFKRLLSSGILNDRGNIKQNLLLAGSNLESNPSVKFRNDSTYVIPPYGLMQPTGTVDVSGSYNYVKVKRPIDSGLLRCPLLINGPREVEVDGYGVAQSGPIFQLLHDGSHTYVAGDRLGAKTGGFSATYGGLFAVIGSDDIATNIVRVMFDTSEFKGKTKVGGLMTGTPSNVYFVDADDTVTSKEYLAETDVSNIPGDTLIWLFPMYGRLIASKVC